ncbi:MAG: carboxy terminal-processing peptidase [bacterium]
MKKCALAFTAIAAAVLLGLTGGAWQVAQTSAVAQPNARTLVKVQTNPSNFPSARIFAEILPQVHLKHLPINTSVVTNALHIYVDMLDYDHSFFLASDIAAFQRESDGGDGAIKKGDVSFAFHVFDVYRDRVSNRVAYAKALLAKGFDINTDESYQWRRKDLPWSENELAWNDLWRKKVKNDYLNRVVADRLASEARTNAATAAISNAVLLGSGTLSTASGTVHRGGSAGPVVAATNLAVFSTNATPRPPPTPDEFVRKRYEQFRELLQDGSDDDFVIQRYLTAFAQAYDPHSDYMTASSVEDFDIGMKLSLFGIGALLTSEDGAAKVERIIPGGPADRDGRLKAGDRIIAVGQGSEEPVDVLHWPLSKTVRLIRGEKGTHVVLTVIPASDISGVLMRPLELVRDEVKLEEQAARGHVDTLTVPNEPSRRIGVVTLPAFYVDIRNKANDHEGVYRSSCRDVADIIGGMLRTGQVDAVLLDLRNNGGGSLSEAVEMTGLFITAGPVVQVRETGRIQVLTDSDPDCLYAGPLVILVNRQSASASEILAAALQDYGRAVIVGDAKTHGKGTVQQIVDLGGKENKLGAAKLTMASFHRIAGGSTQLRGVVPDIVIPSVLDHLEIGEEYLPNAMVCSIVKPTHYRAVSDIASLVPVLRAKSEARRTGDSRFQAYQKLLTRVAERQQSKDVTLNLAKRLEQAHTERELDDLQKDALDDDALLADGKAVEKQPDLVLHEAERILVDLMPFWSPAAP